MAVFDYLSTLRSETALLWIFGCLGFVLFYAVFRLSSDEENISWVRKWFNGIGCVIVLGIIGIVIYTTFSLLFESAKGRSETPPVNPMRQVGVTIDTVLGIPEDFKPVYKRVRVEDEFLSNKKVKIVRITVPAGLSVQELTLNLLAAVRDAYKRYRPAGIRVLAAKKTLSFSDTSAGSCIFAPYGDMTRVGEKVPLSKYGTRLSISPTY